MDDNFTLFGVLADRQEVAMNDLGRVIVVWRQVVNGQNQIFCQFLTVTNISGRTGSARHQRGTLRFGTVATFFRLYSVTVAIKTTSVHLGKSCNLYDSEQGP